MKTIWSTSFRYWLLTVLAVIFALLIWAARELISPLIIGALLAFILSPTINFLQKRTRLSHSLLVSIVVIGGLIATIALIAILTPTLFTQAQVVGADVLKIFEDFQVFISEPIIFLGLQIDLLNVLPDYSSLFSEGLTAIPENAVNLLEATSRNFIWFLVIIATAYYLLRDWLRLRDWVYSLVPSDEQASALKMYSEIKDIWQGYFRGNLLLMFIVGVVFSIAWSIIGLPGAVILGVLTGLLSIIPDLGPAIAALFAVLIAFVEGSTSLPISNFIFGILVLGLYLILINIKALWLRPLIFARSVHLHDGIVFIAIMSAVILQGILGAIIIVPIMASIGVLARYIYRRMQSLPYEDPS